MDLLCYSLHPATCSFLLSDDSQLLCKSDVPNLLTVLMASITGIKFSLSSRLICTQKHKLLLWISQTGINHITFSNVLFEEEQNTLRYLKEHSHSRDPPSFPDGLIQALKVIWIVTVDLHLNEQQTCRLAERGRQRSTNAWTVNVLMTKQTEVENFFHLQRVFHPIQAVFRPIWRGVAATPVEGDSANTKPGAQTSSTYKELPFHINGH